MNATVAKLIINAYNNNEAYALHDYLEENQIETELLESIRHNLCVSILDYNKARDFLYKPKEEYYKSLSLKSFLNKCKHMTKEEFAYCANRLGEYKHRVIRYHFDKEGQQVYLRNFCLNPFIYNKKHARAHLQNCMLIAKHFNLRPLLKEINRKYNDLRWVGYTEPKP